MGISFWTGYSYYSTGSENCVSESNLLLKDIEAEDRAAELPTCIEFATNLTWKIIDADMLNGVLDPIVCPCDASWGGLFIIGTENYGFWTRLQLFCFRVVNARSLRSFVD